ncbi:hypothetical protein JIN81_13815 [Haloferula rosea]|uniref:Uncharacterized protein n=1 Tax=Haloferula rosea TaxID=490093 RepID=A0A934RAF6_9BACT|nr:hypothetical protein [Haloferula rosea]
MVAKRDRQQAQIRTLESQLIVLRDKINSAPEDRSEELAELKEVVARDEKSIAELRTSIALLKQQATELKEELDAYKAKYPLR